MPNSPKSQIIPNRVGESGLSSPSHEGSCSQVNLLEENTLREHFSGHLFSYWLLKDTSHLYLKLPFVFKHELRNSEKHLQKIAISNSSFIFSFWSSPQKLIDIFCFLHQQPNCKLSSKDGAWVLHIHAPCFACVLLPFALNRVLWLQSSATVCFCLYSSNANDQSLGL